MTPISSDQALRIARADAESAYGHLDGVVITIALMADSWHIDYELQDITHEGGGPHYVIDPFTGVIFSKRYEQ